MTKRVSREALYDLMERSNRIISQVHAVGSPAEKEAILEIGKSINRKGKLTDLLVHYEEWFRGAMKYFKGDKEAEALLEEVRKMNDSNPHTEWRR
jgi:hypothetical protein